MAYGARELGLTESRASVGAPNVAPVRLLERLGFAADARDGEGARSTFRRPAAGRDDGSVELLRG